MIRAWATTALFATIASVAFTLIGMPSPVLFGALVGGVVYAVLGSHRLSLPEPCFTFGQAVVGVTIGALVDMQTLGALGTDLAPILGACIATLVISVAGGYALRVRRDMSLATGVFAMVAGGASGVTAIAHELGADERVVAMVQYLRVLLVLIAMPVVTAVVFRPPSDHDATFGDDPALLGGLAFTALSVGIGLLLARWFKLPAGSLLGPMLVSIPLALSGWFDPFGGPGVPAAIVNVGYALIGIQVGLRFTRESLKSIASLLPRATVLIFVVIAACAGLAVVLAWMTGESMFDAYLATTPGGLYAVLATAIESGSNVTFVLGVQVMRLIVMLLAAPLLARWLRRRGGTPQDS